MAKYRIPSLSFINNTLVEEDAIIEFDGEPGSEWELVKEEKAAKGKTAADDEAAA